MVLCFAIASPTGLIDFGCGAGFSVFKFAQLLPMKGK